jgi:lysophospholipase L1-like esterase
MTFNKMTRAALILFQTLILLTMVESAARMAEWLRPRSDDLAFDYAPYRMLRMTRAPWPLNRDGFRARELETYRNTFLIEFLGGSVCLGVGTNPGQTLPERLQAALDARGLARAAVLNLCQGGATSAQELAIFLQYGLPLDPKVVLSFDGANDLLHPRPIGEDEAANLPYRNAQMRAWFEGHHTALAHLALVRVMGRIIKPPLAAGPAVPEDLIVHSYEYAIEVTRTLAESRGALYAVLLQPALHYRKPWSAEEKKMWRERSGKDGRQITGRARELYSAAAPQLRQWAAARDTTFLDLTGVFAHTSETVYSDSVHFTGERGYALLFNEVERQGLLDRIAARYHQWEAHQTVIDTTSDAARKISWAR